MNDDLLKKSAEKTFNELLRKNLLFYKKPVDWQTLQELAYKTGILTDDDFQEASDFYTENKIHRPEWTEMFLQEPTRRTEINLEEKTDQGSL